MDEKEKELRQRARESYKSTVEDLKALWDSYCRGEESVEDLGNIYEYGLSFDYVAPGTFKGQRVGYFRYQLSWGGPSTEFRFYVGPGFEVARIEFWFLDWFCGTKIKLSGTKFVLLQEIFESFFKDSGTVEHEYRKALEM